MGNVYYRYPKWRVSPYAGVGFGAFFYDRTVTSTVTVENIGQPFLEIFPMIGDLPPVFAGGATTFTDEDSRFAYQIMGGLSAQISQNVEFHFGYRFRSSRGGPSIPTRLRAASGSGLMLTRLPANSPTRVWSRIVAQTFLYAQPRPGWEAQLR